MTKSLRGADIIARCLDQAGHRTIFTLSGNHIMAVFDAVLDTGIELFHTRHEAAAVHMADAFARLTGDVGIALVTGGQGHTNAVAALTTAQCAEAPLVLLSGHASTKESGRGGFQELGQAEMARPVTKASWTVTSVDLFGHDLAKAIRIAKSGRPGPVHLSLPSDLLEGKLEDSPELWPKVDAWTRQPAALSDTDAGKVLAAVRGARRPLFLAGPTLCTTAGRASLEDLQSATRAPVVGMESPRGINDPALGAFAEVLKQADLIVLLGKAHDFTLKFCEPPFVAKDCNFVVVDPELGLIERAQREKPRRVPFATAADADCAAHELIRAAKTQATAAATDSGWLDEVISAISHRPPAWSSLTGEPGKLHPFQMCGAIQSILARDANAVFISDGGEVGQWAQAGITAPRRLINGVAGSIGSGLPFALAARVVERKAPVVAVSGDGAFGFHVSEIDTAVRHGLPVVMVVGNDAAWNAEYQIQLRDYGRNRVHSCTLLPTRYDDVAKAFGGHGELVTDAAGLAPALERAIASGKPSVVNVMIEGPAAPVIRR